LSLLKAALNRSFHDGLVASDLAWRRVRPFKGVDAARTRFLIVAEAKRLINACDPGFRPLVRAALETGCRYGEVGRLEVADFSPEAGKIAVRRSKTDRPRHVVLTDEGVAFFRQVCAGRAGGEIMFRRPDGEPWRPSNQGRLMAAACERARISPPITFHGLRHTWASIAMMNGMPPLIIARNLGHTSTRMVEKHYGHLAPSFIDDAIRSGAPKFGLKPDQKVAALGVKP